MHDQPEAAVQLAGKPARAGRIVVWRAIGVERHAHHQGIRFPLVDQPLDGIEARRPGLADRAQPTCVIGDGVADGDSDALRAEIEGEVGARSVVGRKHSRMVLRLVSWVRNSAAAMRRFFDQPVRLKRALLPG